MKLKYSVCSEKGIRSSNQDNFSVGEYHAPPDCTHIFKAGETDLNEPQLFVVADGMGGEEGGEIAALTACRAFEEHFYRPSYSETAPTRVSSFQFEVPTTHATWPILLRPVGQLLPQYAASVSVSEMMEEPDDPQPDRFWEEAVDRACLAVEEEMAWRGLSGGCTVVAVCMDNSGTARWVSAGDSMLYRLHHKKLTCLNTLDNLYYEHLMAGVAAHPREKSLLTNHLGLPDVTLHTGEVTLEPGDTLLLATDGIDLSERALGWLLRWPGTTAEHLTARASGRDNATALVLRF